MLWMVQPTKVVPVSNNRSWLDKKTKALEDDINSSTQKSEACVKAIGGAEGTGRLVGTSVGAASLPLLLVVFHSWVGSLLVG